MTSGIGSLSSLFSLTSSVTRDTREFADQLMANQGYLIDGMDIYESLSTLTSDAVSTANNLVSQMEEQYDLPEYTPYSFNPPASYATDIAAAMNQARDVQAQLAADPTWEGTPSASTLREIQQLELQEQQNAIMQTLSTNMGDLAANTNGLTDMLNDMQTTATNSNTTLNSLLSTINGIQSWLFNLEQQLAAQTSAAEAAAAAAAAAAEAAESTANTVNNLTTTETTETTETAT